MTPLSLTFFSAPSRSWLSARAARPTDTPAASANTIVRLMSVLLQHFADMRGSPDCRRCRVDRLAEPFHDRVDCGGIDDEGRGKQDVVAALAVDRPAHGIDHQPPRHRFVFDARMQLQFRVERFLAAAIGDEFESLQEAAPAHVADEGMIAEALLQPARKICALRSDVGQEIVAAYHPLHGQSGGAGERMTHIRVRVLEGTGALREGLENSLLQQQRADRRISAAKPLRDRHQIGAHSLLLAGVQRAAAAHAAHHLIEDEQDAVAAADLPHALEIARHRGNRAHGGADYGLGYESDDVLAAERIDLCFELVAESFAVGLRRLAGAALAVFIDRRDVMRLDQKGSELLALPLAAPDRQRTERDAMIALPSRDDVSPLRLAAFDEILARELERGLDGLRAAADEKGMTHAVRRVRHEIVLQLLRNVRREEARMRVGEAVELLAHRCQDIGVRMAETRHRCTARGIDIVLARDVADGGAAAARGDGIGMADLAMKNIGHASSLQ